MIYDYGMLANSGWNVGDSNKDLLDMYIYASVDSDY
jgi:hypothetical protein